MTDAELMMALFEGSDLAHGRAEMVGTVSSKGKHEAKCWTVKSPVTLTEWTAHLRGERGLGLSPIASTNLVRWGAIDVDVYTGLSLENLNTAIQTAKLPLVLCRSKSGGPHIYLFLDGWVTAKMMIEKLDDIASFLGFGDSEIFPKQTMISKADKEPDFGNWINMPYFAGMDKARYALDENNNAITTVPTFVEFARRKMITARELQDFAPPGPAEDLPDGPPCLNRLFSQRANDNRNIILANACVWARKAHPDAWESEIDRLNRLFPEPLGSTEVEALKKSYAKKEYKFQCNKTPLCSFCNSSLCKKKKHGVGGGDLIPASRSLTKVDTNPPIWYLDLELSDGRDHRISLSTEQLQTPRLFQRRCMETIHSMPPAMKAEEWQPIVEGLMKHVTIISVPPEMSAEGLLVEMVWEFLHNRAEQGSFDDLIRGVPHRNEDGYNFRMRDLMTYLRSQQFNLLKPHEVTEIIRSRMGGVNGRFRKILGRGVNYVFVPPRPEDSPDDQQPIPPKEINAAY